MAGDLSGASSRDESWICFERSFQLSALESGVLERHVERDRLGVYASWPSLDCECTKKSVAAASVKLQD